MSSASLDPIEAHIDAIAQHAPALDAYRQWLGEQGSQRGDYLFTATRVRFEPRPGDVVVARPGLTVDGDGDGCRLVVAEAGAKLPLAGVRKSVADALLRAMDGRCLLEVAWAVDEAALAALLRVGFGKVLFAPQAVNELQARVSAAGVVRFPVDPYAVERAYWQNMAAVSERLTTFSPPDATDFWRNVRRLHVVALMGEQLDSFYRPASPGAARGFVAPGALFLAPVRGREAADGTRVLLSGPRVRAKALGSEAYVEALVESLPQTADHRDGWGRVVQGRGGGDPAPEAWFLPPRPITAEHLHAVFDAWKRRHDVAGRAELHWRFVRLHPFACGNQSLVMAMVNHARGEVSQAPIPHLVLDHWALRLPLDAYGELYARAESAFASGDFASQVAEAARLQRVMGAETLHALTRQERHAGLLE